jgi:cobalt/nickel transport system permease protein
MIPIWMVAGRKLRKSLSSRRVPLLAIGAAFSFVIMMFNIPIPGGSTGHATGAALIAILLGPWAAVLAVSVVLVVQALLFGDGGITAIGANCFNMAVVVPFVSYGVYRLVSMKAAAGASRRVFAAALAGYIGLNVAAITTAIMFGIQPLIAHGADGRPLYAPFPLTVAISAMAAEHLLIFGFVEAAVTGVAVAYLARTEPDLLAAPRPAVEGGRS